MLAPSLLMLALVISPLLGSPLPSVANVLHRRALELTPSIVNRLEESAKAFEAPLWGKLKHEDVLFLRQVAKGEVPDGASPKQLEAPDKAKGILRHLKNQLEKNVNDPDVDKAVGSKVDLMTLKQSEEKSTPWGKYALAGLGIGGVAFTGATIANMHQTSLAKQAAAATAQDVQDPADTSQNATTPAAAPAAKRSLLYTDADSEDELD